MEMISAGGEDPRGSPPLPSDEEWEDLEDNELEEFAQEEAEKLDQVRRFLTIADRQFKYVTFGDGKETIQIKVKAAIPYEVRERQKHLRDEIMAMYAAAREKAETLGLDPATIQINDLKLQRPMYEMLASLCMEEPWNDWKTWAVIDRGVGDIKGSGMGPVMLHRIFQTIDETAGDIKSFRAKR